jgi:hypothetical protein
MEGNPSTEGPDFLCIGMGKSGTGWIYDQCQRHPDFWMPPIRELHYLDNEYPRRTPKTLEKIQSVERRQAMRQRRAMRLLEDRDFVFAEEMKAVKGQPMDLERYAAMFRFKGNQLSGDVTPSYCTLPEELIARVMARFPHLKIFLMIRDPVSRAWSHFSMKHRGDKIETATLREPDKFREMLRESKVMRMGSPAGIYRTWSNYLDPAMFRYYFFEGLTADSEGISRDVLTFLGCDPAMNPVDAAHNRKAEKPKLDMTPEIHDILVRHFADQIADCARTFGGHANAWAAKYGIDTA